MRESICYIYTILEVFTFQRVRYDIVYSHGRFGGYAAVTRYFICICHGDKNIHPISIRESSCKNITDGESLSTTTVKKIKFIYCENISHQHPVNKDFIKYKGWSGLTETFSLSNCYEKFITTPNLVSFSKYSP